ncbi:protein DCL homolog, chloroplastic [Humulus lupulus]|uniref:protein DCL homolog, chloroplastic n=1 Tax=Humulus lupulus TaxID=3486 RepID=UPI002B40E44F|nr:protein DCL homolog, chloroplastic [Humulus lupulus]
MGLSASSHLLATHPMAAPMLLRGFPLLHLRLQLYHYRLSACCIPPPRWHLCTAAIESTRPEENTSSSTDNSGSLHSVKDSTKYQRWNDADYRQWKNKEEEILKDISPIVLLTKNILHSGLYMDGERLTPEDEKAVVERLLSYHPHAEDKIGCGLDSIMVDRHPQFSHSRCLFIIRTDGAWIDFSYQKCLRQYVREKYPSHAERFIREHFKRGSGL